MSAGTISGGGSGHENGSHVTSAAIHVSGRVDSGADTSNPERQWQGSPQYAVNPHMGLEEPVAPGPDSSAGAGWHACPIGFLPGKSSAKWFFGISGTLRLERESAQVEETFTARQIRISAVREATGSRFSRRAWREVRAWQPWANAAARTCRTRSETVQTHARHDRVSSQRAGDAGCDWSPTWRAEVSRLRRAVIPDTWSRHATHRPGSTEQFCDKSFGGTRG